MTLKCQLCDGDHLSASVHSYEELKAWEDERAMEGRPDGLTPRTMTLKEWGRGVLSAPAGLPPRGRGPTMSEWVKVPAGRNNWLRFDPLNDEDMAAVVKRLDEDYSGSDMAGRYAQAWLDVARLLSTFAAVQSLVAMMDPERPRTEPLDVRKVREVLVDVMLNDRPEDTVYSVADRIIARLEGGERA